MKHLTPYRQNETTLSPVRGKGMELLSKEAGRKGGLLVVVMPVGLWRIDNLVHQPTLCRNSSNDSSGNISTPSPRLICSLASSTRAKNSSLVRRVGSASFSETSFRKYLAARFSRFSSSAMILILRRISAFICIAVIIVIFLFSGARTVQAESNQVHLNCRGVARSRCLRLQRYKEKSNNQRIRTQ